MAETETDNSGDSLNIEAVAQAKQAQPARRVSPKPAKAKKQISDKGGYHWGTGRRKSSVARVRIKPGDGKLLVNKKELSDYFKREQDRKAIMSPLLAVEGEKSFDVFVNVRGGGTTGQAGATLLGIARALKNYDENYIHVLRNGGYLTRDGRMVERKKPGQRGARRRFQFSKR
ncbi:MAG: 30S ribosomal protein S9 [Planctomycetota bacterium]|jgi:small subunit ribosomal protein S9